MLKPLSHIADNAFVYHPFGELMPGRTYTSTSTFKFGYQGSLKDDEITIAGGTYSTFYRELDPRLGIWWGRDPETKAWESPYVSMGDNPIWHNDVLGNTFIDKKGKAVDVKRDDKGKLQYTFDKSYSAKKRARVEKAFIKDAAPVLDAMNSSEEGYKDIQTLNSIPTLVTLSHTNTSSTYANSFVYLGSVVNGYYDEVKISPFLKNYDPSKGDFNEWLGSVMTVETGHLKPEQISIDQQALKDNSNFKQHPESPEFVRVYTPLLNKATDFRIKYRIEKNMPLDKNVFSPLDTYPNIPYNDSNRQKRNELDGKK